MLYESSRLRLECSDQVATLSLDARPNNVLTLELLADLKRAIGVVRRSRAIDVLIIRSARPGHFLTGPDLDEYANLSDDEARRAFARAGQETLQRLQDLSSDTPTIAYIDGECRDAGMEFALTCDFRLAVARPETRFGIGCAETALYPCWGATQRLPRLIGLRPALDLLVRGDDLPARAAKQIGLIDHAFSPRAAKTELWWFIADVQDNHRRGRPGPRRSWPWEHRLLCDATVFRPLLKRHPIGCHLRPVIEAVRRGWHFGLAAGYAAERETFVEHAHHPAHAWRRQLFRQRCRFADAWNDVPLAATIGVTRLDEPGMALTLAALAAGASVVISCADSTQVDAEREAVRRELLRAVARGWFNVLEAEQKLRQTAFVNGERAMTDCDLVFLTGPAPMQAATLLDLDSRLTGPVVIAPTSKDVSLERLVGGLHFPERVVGIDFSSLSGTSSSAELSTTRWTDEFAVARLFRWLDRCGYRPKVVGISAPAELQQAA